MEHSSHPFRFVCFVFSRQKVEREYSTMFEKKNVFFRTREWLWKGGGTKGEQLEWILQQVRKVKHKKKYIFRSKLYSKFNQNTENNNRKKTTRKMEEIQKKMEMKKELNENNLNIIMIVMMIVK